MREKSPEEFPGAVFSLFPFLNLFVPGEFGDEIRHNRAGIRKASFTIRLLALTIDLGPVSFSFFFSHTPFLAYRS